MGGNSSKPPRSRRGRHPKNRPNPAKSSSPSNGGNGEINGMKNEVGGTDTQITGKAGNSEAQADNDRKPPPILAPKPTKSAHKPSPPPILAPKPTKSELLQQTRELPWILFPVPAYQGERDLEDFTIEGVGQGPVEPVVAPQQDKKASGKASPFAGNIAAEAMSLALKRQHSSPVEEPLVIKEVNNNNKSEDPKPAEQAKANLKPTPPIVNKAEKPASTPASTSNSNSNSNSGNNSNSAPDSPQKSAPPTELLKKGLAPSAEEEVSTPKKTPPPADAEADSSLFDGLQPKVLSPSPKKGIVKQKGKRLPRKPMRIHNDDDSYKSLALSTTATAEEVVKEMAEKNHIEDDKQHCLCEVDSITWAERKLDSDEIPLAVVLGWDPEKRADMRLYFKGKSSPACHANKNQSKDEQKARKEQEGTMRRRTAYRGLVSLETGTVVEVELLHQHSASEVVEMVITKAKLKASDNWRIFEVKGAEMEVINEDVLVFEVLLGWGNNLENKFLLKKVK